MTRPSAKPQHPRHVPILDEDWEFLIETYGPTSDSKLGPGPVVRKIVHTFVQAQKAKIQGLLDAPPLPAGAEE